jgi:hypothetical protein
MLNAWNAPEPDFDDSARFLLNFVFALRARKDRFRISDS